MTFQEWLSQIPEEFRLFHEARYSYYYLHRCHGCSMPLVNGDRFVFLPTGEGGVRHEACALILWKNEWQALDGHARASRPTAWARILQDDPV